MLNNDSIKTFRKLGLLCSICLAASASGQELEPRVYAALPKNLNSLAVVYILASGNVLTDPSLPVTNLKLTTHSMAAGYLRTFGVGNKLGRVQVVLPFVHIAGKVQISGRDTSGVRSGFGDAKIRLGINLTGSPPLDKKAFTSYTQKTIFGISLVTSIPAGLYYSEKRINIGSNRWAFKPEAGISKRVGRVYAEAYGGLVFYTNNTNYLGGKTLIQKPVFNVQGHASYFFKNRMMVSLNNVWFEGGETLIDGISEGEQLNNWRVGATWSVPVAQLQSLKLQFHVGAFTASGYDYKAVSLTYQYLF